MPNHITNRLTAYGAPDDVRRFFEAIDGGVDESGRHMLIDFNKIKPMPESLNVNSGSRSDKALRLYTELKNAGITEVSLALGDQGAESVSLLAGDLSEQNAKLIQDDPELLTFGRILYNNIREHDAPTWYEWCNQNWGTKMERLRSGADR